MIPKRGKGWPFYLIMATLVLLLFGGLLLLAWSRGGKVEETGQAGSVNWVDRLKEGTTSLVAPVASAIPLIGSTPSVPSGGSQAPAEETPGPVNTNVSLLVTSGMAGGFSLGLDGLPFIAYFNGFQNGNPVFSLRGSEEAGCPTEQFTAVGQYQFTCHSVVYQISIGLY